MSLFPVYLRPVQVLFAIQYCQRLFFSVGAEAVLFWQLARAAYLVEVPPYCAS